MTARIYDIEIKELSGSFGAAAFVGQVAYWTKKMSRHFYKSNTSWHQELRVSRSEFDRIRSLVATRISKGMSKERLMRVFNSDGSLAPLCHVILYWKDSSNKMWYWFNQELYQKILEKVQQSYGLQQTPQMIQKQDSSPIKQEKKTQQAIDSSNHALNHALDYFNDDDLEDSINRINDSEKISSKNKQETKDAPAAQDKMIELLKSYNVQGLMLEQLSRLEEKLIRAWTHYVNENSVKIGNKAAYLVTQLTTGDYPPETTAIPKNTEKLATPETQGKEVPQNWLKGYELLCEFEFTHELAYEWASRASIDMFDIIDKGWRIWFVKNPPKNLQSYLLKMIKDKKTPPHWNSLAFYNGEKPDWAKKQDSSKKKIDKNNPFAGLKWSDFAE